ncbi:hypothetical protein KR067_001511 [Drosophila pandora]|nr:hypothetical protein KR067_001511 [Drosophila pandora]
MTEYVTINTVLKKFQTSATKSLQGPGHALNAAGVLDIAPNGRTDPGSPGLSLSNGKCLPPSPVVALIKKEILSSPEPQDLHHECSSRGTPPQPQIYSPATPPRELSQPILSVADAGCGELYETKLEGKTIGCFSVGGEMRLCLPQFLNNVLNDFSLEQINRSFDDLGIYCSQCTPAQLVEFKTAKILPSDVKASGLITRTDAERLCAALLHRSERNSSYVPIESLAKGALSFRVYHKCFGKCEGICTPDMYSFQKPTCIKCLECDGWFSPQKFVGHVDRPFEKQTCHWGFDSRNWHDYLHVGLDVENREKYQIILDQLKEVEIKEMHKAQREMDHIKRKGLELVFQDDGRLGSEHVLGLAGHPHGLVGALGALPPPPPQLDIPGGKKQSQQAQLPLKASSVGGAPPLLDAYHYQIAYAHCVQQHQQREREKERERERERDREHLPHAHQLTHPHRAVLVTSHPPPHHQPPSLNSSSAFRPWGPNKALWQAMNASGLCLPYACQEPPELQNPERVVRSTDKRYAERTYQPNVALAPRKSYMAKEREVIERQRLRDKGREHHQVVHIKQERSPTPSHGVAPDGAASMEAAEQSHTSSSGSNSPLPAHQPPPPAAAATAAGAPPATVAPTSLRNIRSPEEFSAGGSNEITSSTSPHHQQREQQSGAAAAAPPPPASLPHQHVIATVNQHAKLLPSSSSPQNGGSTASSLASNHSNIEPSRIRINKNLMSQQPVLTAPSHSHTHHMHHYSHGYYKGQASSPTQSSSAGLNLSTHSSNVVSSPHPKAMGNGNTNGSGNGHGSHQNGKPHLGSEFELSTDTDDTDSLNGEADSSAMLPPWEQAVESLRETRPRDRERVLNLLQRLLQENNQYRYNNIQLSELLHKKDAQIADLSEQLQRYRRIVDNDCKVDLRKIKQTQLEAEEEVEEGRGEDDEEDLEEMEEMEDRANNNNQQEQSPLAKPARRSATPLNCCLEKPENEEPETKRIKLLEESQDRDVEQDGNSSELQEPQENGDKHLALKSPPSSEEEMEEDEDEDREDEEEEDEDDDAEGQIQAPHSSALATPPTATTPISPDSAATAGQLFDSSNSSDESSMKKAQMSACHALEKISSNRDSEEKDADESQDAAEPEEVKTEREVDPDDSDSESDDDEMPLQQRQQQQRQRCSAAAVPPPQNLPLPQTLPHPPMATKASKKQTPPAPPLPPSTASATTATTTNCELPIKKEVA